MAWIPLEPSNACCIAVPSRTQTRRFHALYDKLARSDVMWRAWVDVATNAGAPGVDGVSIADVEADGVAGVKLFLEALAAESAGQDVPASSVAAGVYPQGGGPGGQAVETPVDTRGA